MGYFSWMFADKANVYALKIDERGVLLCPDGKEYVEPCYEGYGMFGDVDVYDLVADWNRKFLAANPNFPIYQHGAIPFKLEDGSFFYFKGPTTQPVSSYPWYKHYANLKNSREDIVRLMKEETGEFFEYRHIGIEISCYDDQNAALPYPIKVASKTGLDYPSLPASEGDPNQGC